MTYARAFFDLQRRFAGRVAELSGMPLSRALLEYTNLYIRFGLGRDFDPAHPGWREYLAGLGRGDDGDWTHRFYLAGARDVAPPALVASSGCFSYGRIAGDRVRLHFHDAERDGRSPLGRERVECRLAELAVLFEQMKRAEPRPPRVVGASWLYNLDAYRRLFPPSYLATARVILGRFRHMPLWGQFLDRRGQVKEAIARPFLDRLERHASADGLDECFPFQVLSPEAPAEEFYEFYGVT